MTRSSGAGWLGSVPSSWTVVPARAVFGERKSKNTELDVHLTPSQKYGVLPQTEYIRITGTKVVLNLSGSDNMRHVEVGDFISHLRSFQGGLEYAGISGKVSAAYTVLRPTGRIYGPFYKYLFKSDLYIQALQTTTDQLRDGQSIRYQQFSQIRLPQPPIDTQRAIADYLDRETAQIDAFIAKNEQLIALLTERRAAVIREATTLSPNHGKSANWRSMRISWLFGSTASGTTPPSDQLLEGSAATIPWVTTGELRENTITTTKHGVTTGTIASTSALKVHPQGSLLIAMYGATIGRMGILEVPAASNQAVCALVRPTDCIVEYVQYALLAARERLLLDAVGGGQPNINQETVRAFRIPIPNLSEQRQIVLTIQQRVKNIDLAHETAHRSIELARERRTALISAAVTGMIDVAA